MPKPSNVNVKKWSGPEALRVPFTELHALPEVHPGPYTMRPSVGPTSVFFAPCEAVGDATVVVAATVLEGAIGGGGMFGTVVAGGGVVGGEVVVW
jgi:hypothetical protein